MNLDTFTLKSNTFKACFDNGKKANGDFLYRKFQNARGFGGDQEFAYLVPALKGEEYKYAEAIFIKFRVTNIYDDFSIGIVIDVTEEAANLIQQIRNEKPFIEFFEKSLEKYCSRFNDSCNITIPMYQGQTGSEALTDLVYYKYKLYKGPEQHVDRKWLILPELTNGQSVEDFVRNLGDN